MASELSRDELSREELNQMKEPLLIEFGAEWCGVCQAAEPLIQELRASHPEVKFLWVEDGPGKRLGRSFGVKLWPTLIFMRDGKEVARQVRPTDHAQLEAAFLSLK